MVNTILKEADLFCPNSVRINFTIYHMGIKNNQLIFSGSNGYSNASTGKKFNVSSMFNGGKYQDYLNDAILIRLIEKGKIKETEQLSRSIPTLKDYGDISVRQFLVNGSGLYVSKNRIKSDSFILSICKSHAIK